MAADESWSRVQSTLLILRYSLAAKLIYFAQTIDPQIVLPFAIEFDNVMRNTYLKLVDIETLSDAQAVQLSLPLRFGGCVERCAAATPSAQRSPAPRARACRAAAQQLSM